MDVFSGSSFGCKFLVSVLTLQSVKWGELKFLFLPGSEATSMRFVKGLLGATAS